MNRPSTVDQTVAYPAPRPLAIAGGAGRSPTAERTALDHQQQGADNSVIEGVASAPVVQPGLGGWTEAGRC